MEFSPGLHFLHLLLFALWLGSDLGVFYASRVVVAPSLSPAARITAAHIMLQIDQLPRLCLILILPTGLHLGYSLELLPLTPALVALFWLFSIAWLALAFSLHLRPHSPLHASLVRLDFAIRILVMAGCAWAAVKLARVDWIAWKLMLFSLIVLSGLLIRVQLRPFVAALGQLREEPVPPSAVDTLRLTLRKCRPLVFFIWAALLLNTALGRHYF